ncbi:MAG: hypothetical protein M1812_005406 [Candelaria pacifica]|nr:MAG: hypothetical protein M1812_005406 [Candelaria pacifica]
MPGRLLVMEATSSSPVSGDNNALSNNANAPNRRKSGRAVKKPEMIYPGFSGSEGKRKRAQQDEDPDEEDDASEVESVGGSEGEADEEELKEKKRMRAPKAKKAPTKPAAKRPKTTNGVATKQLALRPASNPPKMPRKQTKKASAKVAAAAADSTGLYSEVFARGHSLEAVAAEWATQWDQHNTNAMRDLINFVLKCTGCDLQIDVHDIEDPDNVTGKLTDLQEEYQALKATDYPLISKAKGQASFRTILTGFFSSLISTFHASSVLYNDLALIENIQVWITTMSSSAIRPFRHTATVIALAIVSELCRVVNEIADTKAKTLRQIQGEKKKSRVNEGRVAAMQQQIEEGDKHQTIVEETMKDIFDTVFVHRYRDVDPKIRADCVQALGDWIITYPDTFFSGEYLRYLGWLLSDISAPTRQEVIKQLQRLFNNKDNFGRLRTFTERFRPRLVEIATRDAEPNVRASSVELLDSIREAGMLEPDDIDVIGKLMFDSEPKVRKAVVGFFAENINDLYESKLEELGGEEALEEVFDHGHDEEFDHPRVAWIKLKCLAEVLHNYDSEDREDLPSQVRRGHSGTNDVLVATGVESRFSLAAQALYDKIPEVKEWEVLAGYLLFDHTVVEKDKNTKSDDAQKSVQLECRLEEREEIILLEVLNEAVKLRLTQAVVSELDKKGKKTKARTQEAAEVQETAARHLAQLIPKLLNKFGAIPNAASAVLRLEHVLNLETFQELRQDSRGYSSLLDDINKQFMSHTDQNVLVEASAALLHAKGFEELEEITDGKVQALWEDNINTLHAIVHGKDTELRGNLTSNALTELSNSVRRISNLVSISDCTEILETIPISAGKKPKNDSPPADPLSILLELLKRGAPSDDLDEDIITLEDELVLSALRSALVYFMWKVHSLKNQITSGDEIADIDIDSLKDRRSAFIDSLSHVLNARPPNDDLTFAFAGTLLDLTTLFATLRNTTTPKATSQKPLPPNTHIQTLVQTITPELQSTLTNIYTSTEKTYAKKSRRTLEALDSDEPLDSDNESTTSSSNEDLEIEHSRQNASLMTEQRLCELTGKIVLAIIARVLDSSGPLKGKFKERLFRNRARLGVNFKEVVAYLDEPKVKRVKRGKAKGKKEVERKKEKSEKVVVEDDDEEEEEDEEVREGGEEGDEEDLRARELDNGGEGEREGVGEEATKERAEEEIEDVEDDIMGD